MRSNNYMYGELIRNARKEKGLTQADLARLIGLKSPVQIIQWEKHGRRPNSKNQMKLEQVLGISFHHAQRLIHNELSATKAFKSGELIRNARKQVRLNQTALGKRLRPKMTQGEISKLENNGLPISGEIFKQLEDILSIRLKGSFCNQEDQNQLDHLLDARHPSETADESAEEADSVNSHTVFKVLGPIEIPCQHKGGGWALFENKKDQSQFWEEGPHLHGLKKGRGVYIYAIQTSEGATIPVYVGKATKGFAQECFNHSNKNKYLNGLSKYREGTAVIFFIVHQSKRGHPNHKAIGKIEQRLIQLAEIRNPDLKNDHHRVKGWSIEGIIGNKRGHQTRPATALRMALGLAEKVEEAP